MADIKYTKMQQAAIDIRDRNILVSAAAGSGKTAVLVERIINRVLDNDDPIDIDRILVMTFTRAAAKQMKEKIIQAIDDRKKSNPDDHNLQKQYILVHNASIMTIDSFCLNVVRNHFEEIDLSPDFRMADEGEIRLLMQDCMDKLIEDKYEIGDDSFLNMVETFAAGKSDIKIERIILDLYKYSQSYPYPDEWLDNCDKEYHSVNENNFDELTWVLSYVNQIASKLKFIRNKLESLLDKCNERFGPKPYEDAVLSDIELVDSLLVAEKYAELYNAAAMLGDYKFKSLKSVTVSKNTDLSDTEIRQITYKRDLVKASRDAYKKELQKIIDNISALSPEESIVGMKMTAEAVSELVKVTKDFSDILNKEKRKRNVVDFNDLEHFCLTILKNGKETTAKEYRETFKEIYVDEYQDSNLCQEEILKYLTDNYNDSKLFMVGDNKQSIYGFRLARPQIFIDKYNKYIEIDKQNESRDIKIDLSDNFRSRIEILNTVNGIFSKLMTKETGGIEYNGKAALNLGASYSDFGVDNNTEMMLAVKDEDVKSIEAEAMLTANKIKELMKNFRVSEGNGSRALRYSDIVILLRSPKGRDNVFMTVFENEGIPVHVTSSQGYFSAPEIVILLDFLKIIDNPLQDIPLAAVMMSVLGQFNEEELAIIRGSFKDGYLYDACLLYADTYVQDNPELVDKIKRFISEINYFRKKSEYSSVEEILTEIIDRDYGNYVKVMPGGRKRYANLNMLINQAREYGKTSFKGIFHFNRYIEAIRKYDIYYGEANILDENDDTVRIMSIHKSKGLEFPVCFLCCTGDKLNLKDAESSIIIDSDYGFATDVFDINKRIKSKSLFRLSVLEKKKNELIAEELRLLYVAMTRAKEKLILTGCIKSEDALSKDIKDVSGARSYLDFINYALEQCRAGAVDKCEYDNASGYDFDDLHNSEASCGFLKISINTVKDLIVNKTFSEADDLKLKEKLLYLLNEFREERLINDSNRDVDSQIESGDKTPDISYEMPDHIEEIRRRMHFVYPYRDDGTGIKMSVSELKHKSDNTSVSEELLSDDAYIPYNTSSVSFGALHGSAVHRIFELWDYNRDDTDESVKDFLEYVRCEKLMEEDLFDTLNLAEILAFVKSDIAKRMKNAYLNGTLRREQPFVISIDENDPDSMLVQGIIDAYFIEDDEIVLVDYKTDKNKTEQMLIEDHKTQLDYYGMALERMQGLKVRDKVIYSTELEKCIII